MDNTRSLDLSVALAGIPEEIWPLLTEAEGITRRFAPQARVVPGAGGTV
ncbi:MAG: hypothetical protein HYX27_09290 [Acidobacteria bacterium]|nr:hypothetical protein [Acidobacteriota bacterium]